MFRFILLAGPDIIRDNSRALAPDQSEGSELPGESPEKKIRTNSRSEYNEAPFENSASGTSTIKNIDDREHNYKVPDRNTKTEDDPDYDYNCKLSWC